MNPLETLSLVLGAGFASGLNLYATVATLGLLQRFGIIHLPENLQVLSHPLVLAIAGVLYVMEFLADKVPIVDSVWQAIHTFIRPPPLPPPPRRCAARLQPHRRCPRTLALGRGSRRRRHRAYLAWHKSQRSRRREHFAGAA